jgi:hypothetical protein
MTAVTNLLASLRNGAWLDQQTFAPLQYVVPGLIPEGSTLLVGPPKIGKSWLVLAVALAVADGGCVLGRLTVPARPVLLLALEDGDRRLQERCRILREGDPIPAGFEYLTVIEGGQVLATIEAWIAGHPGEPFVVMLDTLGKVMPPALVGESAYQRDYRVGTALKRLIDGCPGASLVTSHHDRKANADDFVDSVSGTHGLAGAADTVIVLGRQRHESAGVLKITGRDVAEGEYALRFEAGAAWVLDGANLDEAAAKAAQERATVGLGDRSAEVIALVAEHPDGIRAADIEKALGDDGRRYAARLAEHGRIVRIRRGVYGPVRTPVPTVPMSQPDTLAWDNETLGTAHGNGSHP